MYYTTKRNDEIALHWMTGQTKNQLCNVSVNGIVCSGLSDRLTLY